MFKKASILLLLAVAMFASPVATPVSASYDNPIPMCYPCTDHR